MNELKEMLADILDPGTYDFASDKVRSDRYLSIDGDPVYMRELTIHGTEKELDKFDRFSEMEGIKYE